MHLGSWAIDDLLTFTVNTHTPATGAATDGDGVPTYRVYEDETATPIITGSMALLDDANTTGFYSEQITLSAANGLETGKSYTVYVQVIVGGVTGTMSHSFQILAEVNVTTIENRLGVWTGSGINTILGAFKALLSKAASAPSDIGGTFDPAADSTEAIRDRGDAAWITGGAGALTAAAIWAYVTRTWTTAVGQVEAAVEGSTLTITRGDTFTASITGLGSIASRNKLWFTVKLVYDQADSASIVQIDEGTGLLILNGAAGTAGNGSITVDDQDNGDITIVLKAIETAKLTPITRLRYDVQYFVTATGLVTTVTSGLLTVAADVTLATS